MNTERQRPTRREFVKQTAAASGAILVGLAGGHRPAGAAAPQVFPELNRRARGWLRFLWDKATTDDDWSSDGAPHEWWDQYTLPGVLSYPRFDLHESSYAILMMADQTPAWREVYTRIIDELAGRYPTYWGAVDWLTQIGDDPARDKYPEAIMNSFPERLRGTAADGHSVLAGWAADGFPIYIRFGYADPTNPASGAKGLRSSYRVRQGTRSGGPGGAYDGTFVQDYEYVAGLGDLDACNGRFGVTPDFPGGIYAYFLTDSFPFIPRCFAGTPDTSFRHGPGGGGQGGGPGGGPGGGQGGPPAGAGGPPPGGPPPGAPRPPGQ